MIAVANLDIGGIMIATVALVLVVDEIKQRIGGRR